MGSLFRIVFALLLCVHHFVLHFGVSLVLLAASLRRRRRRRRVARRKTQALPLLPLPLPFIYKKREKKTKGTRISKFAKQKSVSNQNQIGFLFSKEEEEESVLLVTYLSKC